MERPTDWAALWRDLVDARARGRADDAGSPQPADPWATRAREFHERVTRRWAEPDSSRRLVLSRVHEGSTVLDIGAGTGAWTAMLARRAAQVTAVEPSPAMIAVMRENLAARGIANVRIVQGTWPEVDVEPHDYSLCSHAMYSTRDLPAFVRRMISATSRMCFLVLRAPSRDGLMAEAAVHVWGHPLDSPNFTVAYNILLDMGLFPSVLAEVGSARDPRTSPSPADALRRMKLHFGVTDTTEHDAYFRALLRRRLRYQDGRYVWPLDGGSAPVYWSVR